jgi:hypothetical protein
LPHSAFDNPRFDESRRQLTVGGPFVADGPVLGDVTVRFLLIQDPPRGSSKEPLTLHGVGTCGAGDSTWSGTVDLSEDEVSSLRADTIRGIAAAVIVRPAVVQKPPPNPPPPSPDPPFIDTFTWCVSRTVVFPGSSA